MHEELQAKRKLVEIGNIVTQHPDVIIPTKELTNDDATEYIDVILSQDEALSSITQLRRAGSQKIPHPDKAVYEDNKQKERDEE